MPADYDFPPDLIELQKRFLAADKAMKTAAAADDTTALNQARDDAREAAVLLNRDEWLAAQDNRFAAHLALRKAAGS